MRDPWLPSRLVRCAQAPRQGGATTLVRNMKACNRPHSGAALRHSQGANHSPDGTPGVRRCAPWDSCGSYGSDWVGNRSFCRRATSCNNNNIKQQQQQAKCRPSCRAPRLLPRCRETWTRRWLMRPTRRRRERAFRTRDATVSTRRVPLSRCNMLRSRGRQWSSVQHFSQRRADGRISC